MKRTVCCLLLSVASLLADVSGKWSGSFDVTGPDGETKADTAFLNLKEALTTAPALVSIDYGTEAGRIILSVDASEDGWGAVLQQEDAMTRKRRPARYESGIWSHAESQYDALKRETRGLLKALKKFRLWLFGVSFLIETDAVVLVV